MARVYCIPGLGTDRRIFERLVPLLISQDIHYLDYLPPLHRRESLQEYALRLSRTIENHSSDSVVIGMSLGGMVAVELSKIMPFRKVFLISTVKRHDEQPWFFRFLRRIPLHRLVSKGVVRAFARPVTWLMRTTDRRGRDHIHSMVSDRDTEHFKWGHHAALHWRNDDMPRDVVHIHGTHDELFPLYKARPTHIIPQGNHYMIMDRAEEIADIINAELQPLLLSPPPPPPPQDGV